MGRKRKSHESLPTEAPEREAGRGHLCSVYNGEEVCGVMTFNSDNNPTSCGQPGPLPSEVTDDRGGNQTQACPRESKLMDRDEGGISEDNHQSGGESKR